MSKREVERFSAISDSGKHYTIVVYQNFIDVTTLNSQNREELPGLKSMITSTGLTVNYIDPNNFQIVQTGEHLRKV